MKRIQILRDMGRYYLLMYKTFGRPDSHKLMFRNIIIEIQKLGVNSLWIVTIISVFFGAIMTMRGATNFENQILPRYLIGLGTRDSMLLEFSSTIVALILAGKVGSNIASELGTMRVTEQIDALEMMGINSAGFLILPKIIGFMLIIPFLVLLSMFEGIFGGWVFGSVSGVISTVDYLYGIQYEFNPFFITYALIKSVVFAFIISSVASYYGYFVSGGALDVGKSSTKAVVNSSILILLFNIILTKLILL